MAPPKGSETAPSDLEGVLGAPSMTSAPLGDSGLEYAPRPGFGTQGRSLQVMANMYQARFKGPNNQAISVHHYDVDINPVVNVANQKKPRDLLAKVWKQLCADATGPAKKGLGPAAFDLVRNFWTPVLLCEKATDKDIPIEIIVAVKEDGQSPDDDRRRFKVVMQWSSKVDLESIMRFCKGEAQTEQTKEMMLTSLQAMNVLFRQDPSEKYKPSGAQGRKFFGPDGAQGISGGGVVLSGFMQSFRFTQSGMPAVQLDTAYSAFVQPGLLTDVIASLLGLRGGGGGVGRGGRGGGGGDRGGGRGGGPPPNTGAGSGLQELNKDQIRKLNVILRNAKYRPTHRQSERVFSMKGISTQPAQDLKFLLPGRDGKPDQMVSVLKYFKDTYNVTIKKPRLPCVIQGAKNYIPLELVNILPYNNISMRALTSDQTADMIKVAAKPPPHRAEMIRGWRQKLNYENLPKLKAWGVEVNTKMMQVQARVLPPPAVGYRTAPAKAMNGGWNLKGGQNKFVKPGKPLKSWSVISFDRYTSVDDLKRFIPNLIQNYVANGGLVQNTSPPIMQCNPDLGGSYMGIQAGLMQAAKAAYMATQVNPQLLIVIEARKDTFLKAEIKRIAATELNKPVVTQVLLSTNLKKDRGPLDQYVNNVTMKINLKLGGVTHTVKHPLLDTKTMMIGADVTHPPPKGGPIPPSIAVTIAATTGENCLFSPCIRLQDGRTEIIKDLENMVYNHLLMFEKNQRAKPEKILMFRDGVSEGQYAHCVHRELDSIKKAAARFGGAYKPKVTFVVCAKRHSMRFFAQSEADQDRTGNLPPGLVVDKGVTHPFAFDFYLQAHAGLQGTARPTHYVVVKDEIGFTPDSMQTLANTLSYSFARATRSVKIVPVAYYSDIICTAARDLVYTDDSDGAPTESSGSKEKALEFDPLKLKKRFEDNVEFNSVAWYM